MPPPYPWEIDYESRNSSWPDPGAGDGGGVLPLCAPSQFNSGASRLDRDFPLCSYFRWFLEYSGSPSSGPFSEGWQRVVAGLQSLPVPFYAYRLRVPPGERVRIFDFDNQGNDIRVQVLLDWREQPGLLGFVSLPYYDWELRIYEPLSGFQYSCALPSVFRNLYVTLYLANFDRGLEPGRRFPETLLRTFENDFTRIAFRWTSNDPAFEPGTNTSFQRVELGHYNLGTRWTKARVSLIDPDYVHQPTQIPEPWASIPEFIPGCPC